jgi:hypothetical protein
VSTGCTGIPAIIAEKPPNDAMAASYINELYFFLAVNLFAISDLSFDEPI